MSKLNLKPRQLGIAVLTGAGLTLTAVPDVLAKCSGPCAFESFRQAVVEGSVVLSVEPGVQGAQPDTLEQFSDAFNQKWDKGTPG